MTEYIDPVFGTRRTQEQTDTDRQIREYGESLVRQGEQGKEQRQNEAQKAAFEEYVGQKIREWTRTGGSETSFRETYTEGELLRQYLDSKPQREEAAHQNRAQNSTPVF